jgi:hypothetical protein
MSTIKRLLTMVVLLLGVSVHAGAQNVNDALLFSNQAVQFGDQREIINPVTGVMPGTAYASGFGTFLDNPASIALFDKSFGEFGLTYRTISEDANYLGTSRTFDDTQTKISNVGFIYSFPTTQGSLVVGAGYNQHSAANRALGINARNENSTITDQFKSPGNTLSDIAFYTFAIDYGDEFEDWDESILRVGFDQFGDFLGIRQQGEITERGNGGEYSAFIATEFLPNLMVGASIGILAGELSYDRVFQEVDNFNDYNFSAIDSDDDGEPDTDIDTILLSDELDSRYSGFRGRIGALYKLTPNVNVGASYTLPAKISVDENYSAEVRTTFDNQSGFNDNLDSEFSYKVSYPSRVNFGVALDDLQGLSVSLSTEYTDYSNVEIEFESSELFEDELAENEFISNGFAKVWNFKGGVSYDVNQYASVRAGYGFFPSRFKNGLDDKNLYSAGVGFDVGQGTSIELGAIYMRWEEESSVYSYTQYDYSPLPDEAPLVDRTLSEDAFRTADLFQLMGTIRFAIN